MPQNVAYWEQKERPKTYFLWFNELHQVTDRLIDSTRLQLIINEHCQKMYTLQYAPQPERLKS